MDFFTAGPREINKLQITLLGILCIILWSTRSPDLFCLC